ARGLKPLGVTEKITGFLVAPHAGAWIETCSRAWRLWGGATSRPTRARGLKLGVRRQDAVFGTSRPTRARGLKLSHQRSIACSDTTSRPTRARGLKLLKPL